MKLFSQMVADFLKVCAIAFSLLLPIPLVALSVLDITSTHPLRDSPADWGTPSYYFRMLYRQASRLRQSTIRSAACLRDSAPKALRNLLAWNLSTSRRLIRAHLASAITTSQIDESCERPVGYTWQCWKPSARLLYSMAKSKHGRILPRYGGFGNSICS